MIHKPLYHSGICGVPSPDSRLLAVTERGTSNVYLLDPLTKKVVGNTPNPQAGPTTNPERATRIASTSSTPAEPAQGMLRMLCSGHLGARFLGNGARRRPV